MEAAALHAARTGALEDLRSMVAKDRALVLRAADYLGRSSLSIACLEGHTDVVSFLLGVPGIEINHADGDRCTSLLYASSNGYAAIVQLLLAAPGIEVDQATRNGFAPLVLAAWKGHDAIVRSLVRHGAITHDLPAWAQPEAWSRSVGRFAIANYLRDVHAAGGIVKYRAEPRLKLLKLRALCQQGRASVVGDRTAEETDIAVAATSAAGAEHDTKRRRRLLYEWLLGAAAQRPAVRDDDNAKDFARAALVPRVARVPGGTDSGPLRLILEYWWSP
jgi:hypothetical protein